MINNVIFNPNYSSYNYHFSNASPKKNDNHKAINELPNCYNFVINKKSAISFGNSRFGSSPVKIIGTASIFYNGKLSDVDVTARKINDNIINLSLIKDNKCFGFTDIIAEKDNIKVLLMDTEPNTRNAGTQMMQKVFDMASKLKKGVVLDSVRVDDIRDNPVMFYYSLGFVAKDKNIHEQIMKEIEAAKLEDRRPDPNIFDKFGEIPMRLSEEGMKKR